MLQRIVMPTDGSIESEKPLSVATQLARAQDAELTLLRVVEELHYHDAEGSAAVSAEIYEEVIRGQQQDAIRSLDRIEQRLLGEGVRVTSEVRRGNAVSELFDYLASNKPDLVVMATHGRTGLARFAMGSVTDRMVREGSAPVLVTRMGTEPSSRLDRALVMLDGSGVAEEVLPLVTALAGKPLQHLTLYRVVADPGDRSAAATYLEGAATHLAATGITVETKIDLGDPRANIERAAEDVDLVILCTHGRSGLDRLRHGSIAEHVMHTVDAPALLVRAKG